MPGGKVAWVDEILVAEDARRQGIGRALMAEFESWAENGRCRLIGLATRAAATFYEELGFEDSVRLLQALPEARGPHQELVLSTAAIFATVIGTANAATPISCESKQEPADDDPEPIPRREAARSDRGRAPRRD